MARSILARNLKSGDVLEHYEGRGPVRSVAIERDKNGKEEAAVINFSVGALWTHPRDLMSVITKR